MILTQGFGWHAQAVRLVKHSIMQVESVEADIEDVDMLDDFSNVQTTVRNFRQRNDGEGDGGQGPAQPGDRPSGNGDDDDDDAGVRLLFCLKVSVACRARHASDHDIFMRLQDDGLQGERCMLWAGALAAKAMALSLP